MKALVTGASSGIGKAIAYELASLGYDLVLVARRENILLEIKDDLQNKYSINVKVEALDLLLEENIVDLFNRNKDVAILINNAGKGNLGIFDNINIEDDFSTINLNIVAFHSLLKKYHKLFKENKYGYILNVSSVAGFQPGPKMATYYASKGYELLLSEAINYEDKKEKNNVKVCCLCPGSVESEFDKNANVKHSLPSLKANYVAKKAVKGMFKGKEIIFPSTSIKLRIIFSRFISRKMVCKIIYKIQSKKEK